MIIELTLFLMLLQVKHFIIDYPLQTQQMIASKGIFADGPGVVHSLLHAAGSLLLLLFFTSITLAVLLALLDFVLHYLIDFSKKRLNYRKTPQHKDFWTITGADQLAHQLCYLFYALIIFS